jgi:[lysine-biosynthesis-protein LysW]--L-2-aminoadipate ligase
MFGAPIDMNRSGEPDRKKRSGSAIMLVTALRHATTTGGVFVQRFALVASRVTQTNRELIHAARARGADAFVADPAEASTRLRAGDIAVGRLDVLPTLDGPEPGIEALRELEEQGIVVLNRAGALLGAHDKLVTALRLGANGLPHPRTAHVGEDADPGFEFPVVVKPRFGSWGKDVTVCRSRFALRRCLRGLGRRPWFQRQGAIVQELVAPRGHDLRVVVAGGEVVGAVERVAAPGEWRTNVALGGTRRAVEAPATACLLALRAADSVGADLVGVDLLPDGDDRWVVLELNGAADFTQAYALPGEDVFDRAVSALARDARWQLEAAALTETLTGG